MMGKENKKEEKEEDAIPDEEESVVPLSDDGATESFEEKIRVIRTKLAHCEKEKQEYLAGWQRTKADFVNARREDEEARKNIFSSAREDTLLQMIPVADSFALAFKDTEAWERLPEGWRKGIEHIHSQLLKIFEENGLKEFSPLGEPFDPLLHESVESVPTENEKEHEMVIAVVQKGYTFNGKIVRAAKVKVGEYKV